MHVIIWLGFCTLVGYYSTTKHRSFWFGFLFSALLSPLIGAIIVLISGNKRNRY